MGPLLISSGSHNLSLSHNSKRVQKQKAEDVLTTLINTLEKRLRIVVASDISLVRNPFSNISLVGKLFVKVLSPGGVKFHIPFRLSCVYSGNTKVVTINALFNSNAEVTILNTDFVEQMIMP